MVLIEINAYYLGFMDVSQWGILWESLSNIGDN